MIEEIDLIDVSEDVRDKLLKTLDYDMALSLASNYKKVNQNIRLFKSLGIEAVEELLLYKSHLFLVKTETLLKDFDKFNIQEFVKLINEDYNVIDELFD